MHGVSHLMNPDWRIGFELLDDSKWKAKLEGELHKVGYRLVANEPESRLIKQFDLELQPLGNGDCLILRLEQDWAQVWSTGILLRGAEEIARLDFDRDERHALSCFEVWIDAIVAAVHAA
jgi:hypothetical protein